MNLKRIIPTFFSLCILMGCSKNEDEAVTASLPVVEQERYEKSIFTTISTTSDINYGSNTTYNGANKNLTLDFYQPENDTETSRPLLILVPGGGFSQGTNKSSVADLGKALAKYGYVVACINYRTYDGTGAMTNAILKKILLQGMQDSKAAIRFFRKDAASLNTYKIDPDKIFIGGHSAGSMVAAHTAYLNAVNKADTEFQNIINSNGGLEGLSGNAGYSSLVSGNINLSGSLLDKNYITNESVPMLGIYGTSDIIMPFNDSDFSLGNITAIPVSGVNTLYTTANEVGITGNEIYAISDGDHFSSSNATCSECLNKITSFLYKLL